jgi:hypothetical protein
VGGIPVVRRVDLMDGSGATVSVLLALCGVLTALASYAFQKWLERKSVMYDARRHVYGEFLRAWWATIHGNPADEAVGRDYSHAKSMFAMYASPASLRAFNRVAKFIVHSNYLEGDFDAQEYLRLLGALMVKLRKDCGGGALESHELLGLTYIRLPDLAQAGVVEKW